MTKDEIIQYATKVLNEEASSVSRLAGYLDEDFVSAVEEIEGCKGRVIVTGIGKSAIIGQKIVGTFNSTGTPAVFMHAADAVHGDLGIIQKDDVVICLSKSGNTPEIAILIPFLKENGNRVDYILTCECPTSWKTYVRGVKTPCSESLEELLAHVDYGHWFFSSDRLTEIPEHRATAVGHEVVVLGKE